MTRAEAAAVFGEQPLADVAPPFDRRLVDRGVAVVVEDGEVEAAVAEPSEPIQVEVSLLSKSPAELRHLADADMRAHTSRDAALAALPSDVIHELLRLGRQLAARDLSALACACRRLASIAAAI